MREEMAALAPGSWALWRLGSDLTGDGWGALVLPELAALLRDEDAVSARAHTCRERCPSGADRVVLRRRGALMRTEAAGLAAWGSPLARRLECWGIRLVLDCDCPQRPSPPPRRAARHAAARERRASPSRSPQGGRAMTSGKADEAKGKLKEAAGALTGDDGLRSEGKADQAGGKLKQAGEKVAGAAHDVADAARGTVEKR
jgi:uncharacterized protein YjbJ (UPF0337 family)